MSKRTGTKTPRGGASKSGAARPTRRARAEAPVPGGLALPDHAPVGLLRLDDRGTVLEANDFAASLLGGEAEALVGQPLAALVAPADHERLCDHLAEVVSSGSTGACELRLPRDDGGSAVVELLSAAGGPDAGGGRCVRAALFDRTELHTALQRLRQTASHAVQAEERERRALAADLHDDVGQILSLVGIRLRAIGDLDEAQRSDQLREIESLTQEARRRVSDLSFEISAPLLYDVGLVAAAEWLCESMTKRFDLRIQFVAEREFPELEEQARVVLFRALREVLINVAKHAGTDRARVQINSAGHRVVITVFDDGRGFDPSQPRRGFGLANVRDRIESLGGELDLQSAPGFGTTIRLELPLETGAPA